MALKALRRLLREARGLEANLYGVGGFARAVLTGRPTHDMDLTVAGHATRIGRAVADQVGAGFVVLHEDPAVVRLVLPAEDPLTGRATIDLSDLRAGTIDEDLRLRDFTVNAIAFRLSAWLETGEVVTVDPVNGAYDLQARRLHLGYPRALDDDPVRALRGIRFVAEDDLQPTPATRVALQRAAGHLAGAPGERVGVEVLGLLRASREPGPLLLWQRTGLLTAVFPELAAADGCSQPREHYWDVLRHSLETALALRTVVDDLLSLQNGPWILQWLDRPVSGGHRGHDVLRLAALLHDVAKPATRAVEGDGKLRFLGHAELGAAWSRAIAARLRLPAAFGAQVSQQIRHHLRPGMLRDAASPPTPRALFRYFRDTEPCGIDLLVLNLADHRAARGPFLDAREFAAHLAATDAAVAWQRARLAEATLPPLLTGHDLMGAFGLAPGPEVGRLLREIAEARAAGEIDTPEAALALARSRLASVGQDRRLPGG